MQSYFWKPEEFSLPRHFFQGNSQNVFFKSLFYFINLLHSKGVLELLNQCKQNSALLAVPTRVKKQTETTKALVCIDIQSLCKSMLSKSPGTNQMRTKLASLDRY